MASIDGIQLESSQPRIGEETRKITMLTSRDVLGLARRIVRLRMISREDALPHCFGLDLIVK
jgi:hypothetical protein